MAQTVISDYTTFVIRNGNALVGIADSIFSMTSSTRFLKGDVLEDYYTETRVDVITDPMYDDSQNVWWYTVRTTDRKLDSAIINYSKNSDWYCLFKKV